MDQNNDFEQIRILARAIASRIKVDPKFKSRVQENPTKTLIAAGLPEFAIGDFLNSTDLVEVSGYMGCSSISTL